MSHLPVKWVALALMAGVALLAYAALRRELFSGWQQSLGSPYFGTNYVEQIVGQPMSTVMLPKGGSLEVRRLSESGMFILTCRMAGSNLWSRALVGEAVGRYGRSPIEIREFTLESVRRTETGPTVKVYGEWVPGGREMGLILLGEDLSFRGFCLGW